MIFNKDLRPMKNIINLVILMGHFSVLFGQVESINQYDSTGKKNGKWILYLDGTGKSKADSTNYTYYRYTFYSHGTHLHPMGGLIEKGGRIEKDSTVAPNSNPKLLDGT